MEFNFFRVLLLEPGVKAFCKCYPLYQIHAYCLASIRNRKVCIVIANTYMLSRYVQGYSL
jgi:hypothetical protein